MQTRIAGSFFAGLLLFPAGLLAQSAPAPAPVGVQAEAPKTAAESVFPDLASSNFVDVGVRGTSFGSDSDPAR